MYKSHEIKGTDKPILRNKEVDQFTLSELNHLNANLNDYFIDGYVQIAINEEVLYEPVL